MKRKAKTVDLQGQDQVKHSFTVHDLPARERPRERLIREGAQALSREEVLAIIISRGTKGLSVLDISRDLIRRYRTMAAIAEAPVEELVQVPGIGPAKACQIKAALELSRRLDEPAGEETGTDLGSADAVARLMRPVFADRKKESFYVLLLDSRNRLICRDQVSVGSLDSTMAHPREVFEKAIRTHAAGIIVVHNHPSGDAEPSEDDVRLTRRLAEAGKIVGIKLLDHVIVAKDSLYSFRSRALL